MSKRFEVLAAVKLLVQAALPGAEVRGLDNAAEFPTMVPPNGLAIVREGAPGNPDVDLSPLTYTYEHRIPVEIAGFQSGALSAAAALDAMLGDIGLTVRANRFLGGLCDWLDVEAPDPETVAAAGAAPARGTILTILATYATNDPLN